MLSRLTALTLAFAAAVSCSSRVAYDPPANIERSAAAVNINTATVEELERLPHIGRRTAEAIVEFRTQNGPFRRPEMVMQIRGISESRFTEIKPYIKTE